MKISHTNPKQDSFPKKGNKKAGFALISTILVVSLLMVVALAMLGISSIETRSSQQDLNRIKAESNARMALMMAIAELQSSAGKDTRVTAPANALAGSSAPAQLTGAWVSWEGDDHDSDGLPLAPEYDSKTVEYDPDADLDDPNVEKGKFIRWLISGKAALNGASNPPSLEEVAEGSPGATVPLVSTGSLGTGSGSEDDENLEVHLEPTKIDESGSYAYWVQGLNSKALIKKPEADPSTAIEWAKKITTNGQIYIEQFGFEKDEDTLPDHIVSQQSANLIKNSLSFTANKPKFTQNFFHDITHYSRGLLTNTATGGWRKDLSLMAENYAAIENKKFFKLTPENEFEYSNTDSIYNWSTQQSFITENGTISATASTGWEALVDFTQQYKSASVDDESAAGSFDSLVIGQGQGKYGVDRRPVLARKQWVFYLAAVADANGTYTPQLRTSLVLTYWNPYNVSLPGVSGSFGLRDLHPAPTFMQFTVGDKKTKRLSVSNFMKDATNFSGGKIVYLVHDSEPWAAGETRVYTSGAHTRNGRINLNKGMRVGNGTTVNLKDNSGTKITGKAGSDKISVELTLVGGPQISMVQWAGTAAGDPLMAGVHYRYKFGDTLAPLLFNKTIEQVNEEFDGEFDLASAASAPIPFMTSIVQIKTIPPQDEELIDNTDVMISRGYTNNNPIARYISSTHRLGGVSSAIGRQPESLTFDWIMLPMNGLTNDIALPEGGLDAENPFGYIGTGMGSSDGLSNLSVAELPTRPIQSIGDLQHFDIAFSNPTPPYISNPIGNSNASYLIKPEHIATIDPATKEVDRSSTQTSFDHSYVANHLLFDDWFASTMTTSTEFDAFIEESAELANKNYSYSNTSSKPEFSEKDSWYNVASQIEVEGMFNVNSTSVEAWKALLKQHRDAQVPMKTGEITALDTGDGTPFPRAVTANGADPEQQATEIAQLTSYSRLTDVQIDALAEEIVEQVKLRGPFLSLSEFVNRQLSEDKTLALAGTIESALVALTEREDEDENPYAKFDNIFTVTPEAAHIDGFNHVFPEAAAGNPVYGYPAWIRQADILRSLAPIITVRDDSFRIRAYGSFNGAEAWCEAIVQRKAEYADAINDDSAPTPDKGSSVSSPTNLKNGRKFQILSFKWLNANEV